MKKNGSSQSGELLATKLTAPVSRLSLVRRTRLTDILLKGMQQRMTLIVAPAGYGKTTLLGEWLATIAATNWHVAWVSLDTHDNDASRFWSYVVAALQKIHPSLQFGIHDLYQGECDASDCMQLNPLINEIAEIPHQFSLILDDYQEIQDPAIHHSFGYFVKHLPENCHLIIASRVMPPLPLSRLRARGQLIEVTAGDLMFTLEEAEVFLSQVMNLDIPWEQIASLLKMTEGWIAGLQLAALSLQGSHQSQQIFKPVGVGSRHILDYMTEEVLNHQEDKVKDFLLKTSILEELSPSLCDALLDRDDSWEMLNYLEEANLFITPLDPRRNWYRYHQLFASLLKMQLQRTYPEQIAELHLAACGWLQQNNFPEKAVPHALEAGEDALAADIVESYALQTIIQLDVDNLIHWYHHMPESIVHNRPRLVLYYLLANLLLGKVEDLEEQLRDVEDHLESMESGEFSPEEVARLRRYSNAVRAAAACTQGDFSLGIRSSQEVLDHLQPEDFFFLGLIEHFLAYAYQAAGRLTEGAAAQERACQNALTHGFHKEYVLSQCEKARFYRVQGKLRAAAGSYQQAIDYAHEHQVDIDIRALPAAGLADIYREWNQIPAAEQLLAEPITYYSSVQPGNLVWFYAVDALQAISRFHIHHKDYESAARCVHLAIQLSQTYHFIPNLYSDVRLAQVELWLAQGDNQSAVNWASRRELQALEQNHAIPVPERLGLAMVYLANDNEHKAGSLLNNMARELEESEYGTYFLKALILSALALWKQGQKKPAARTLMRAVSQAGPQDILKSFIDHGPPMNALLLYTRESLQKEPAYADRTAIPDQLNHINRLISLFEGPPSRKPGKSVSERAVKGTTDIISPVIDPLSDREREVMTLLVQGYSAGDVAKELVISVNTAKAHIKNIYQKLDVHNRKEAIERAIRLQLLV